YFRHLSLSISCKRASVDYFASAWLGARTHGRQFSCENPASALNAATNLADNGDRVRSLLCDREALARPSGMGGFIAKGAGFNLD
ncbi:hypothetical protein JQN41_24285, partial [Escherichia coli]|uniref:hypothetical protein n=1 Tax=Escherichia coli TaxID=562 RepID=UPI0019395588